MDEKKDYIFIFWSESHKSSEKLKSFISIEGEKMEIDPIYKSEEIIENDISSVYLYSIIKNNLEFNFILESIKNNEIKNNVKTLLKSNDIKGDNYFIYNLIPSKGFSAEIQFELFLEMIDNNYKIDTKMLHNIKLALFFKSMDIICDNKYYYDFLFYVSVLVEGKNYEEFIQNYIIKFMFLFTQKKMELNPIRPKRFQIVQEQINIISLRPQNILNIINDNKKKKLVQEWIYKIILLFNYLYQKDKLIETLKNKIINNDLYNFITKKRDFFKDLKFTFDEMNELIKCANDIDSIEKIFSFNNDFIDILKTITLNYEFIKEKYEELKIKKPLNFEKYIVPKENDNLLDIIGFYVSLINLELAQDDKIRMIQPNPEIFEKYLEYNLGINYNNLLFLKKELIEKIQKNDKNFNLKNFDYIFHSTGLAFINDGNFSNEQILNFIIEDNFYKKEYFYKEDFKVLSPLEAINLGKITKNESEIWKSIEWLSIFKNQENNFFSTIFSLVKNLEDFDKIIDLLIENKHFMHHQGTIMKMIKEKLINVFKNESEENLVKNIGIIKKIVKYSMKDNYKDDFVKQIFNTFNKNFVLSLFIKIYDNEENDGNNNIKMNIPPKVKEYIEATINKEIKTESPEILFNIINEIEKEDSKLWNKFKKYIFDSESFFTLEENLKLKLLRLLIIGKIFPSPNSKNFFMRKSFENIQNLWLKIINLEISFIDLNIFFSKEENILIFKERLGFLYLINIKDNIEIGKKNYENFEHKMKEINEYMKKMTNKYKNVKENINIIELIINDFIAFYPIYHKKEISEYKQLISKYINQNFNSDENELEISKIKNEFYAGAENRYKKKDSLLFQLIYEQEKIKFNYDESKSLIGALEKFNEMVKILNLDEINSDIMKICLEVFKNKTREDIRNELLKLENIFELKNNNIEELTNKYELLAYKENIIKVVKATKTFIEEIGSKKTNYYSNLDTIISFCEYNYDIEVINMFLDLLKDIGIDLKNNNKFSNALTALDSNKESIKFLLQRKLEDCGLLHGIVNNGDEDSFLTSADIINFEKCVNFMKQLGDEDELKKVTDYELITKAEKIFKEFKDENSDIYFINYSEQYHKIKELINQQFNKSEALRQKIDDICRKSRFILSNIKKDFFIGKFKKSEKVDKDRKTDLVDRTSTLVIAKKQELEEVDFEEINYNELNDLNVRIQITKKISTDSENKIKSFKLFTDLMNELTNFRLILNDIYTRGYVKEIMIILKINNFKKYYQCEIIDSAGEKKEKNINEIIENIINKENNIKDAKTLLSKLKNIKEQLKKSQKKGYKEYEYIRYMFGRHFNYLYDYIHQKADKEEGIFVTQFLKYITNNEIKKPSNEYKWKNHDLDEFHNIIYNLNEFIKKSLEPSHLDTKKIYSKSKLNDNNCKGFYHYYCVDKLEKQLYQLNKYLTGKSPFAQNILLCHIDTSKEEIESFLNRAIFCKYNSCFMIGGIEFLEFEPKNYLIELLNEMISNYGEKMESCLIVLSFKNSDISKSIEVIKNRKTFEDKISDEMKRYILDENDGINLYSSDKSGIGKSKAIEILNEKNKYKYYFPLGGVFTRENIFNRLNELNIQKNSSIHLDLCDTDEIDLMNDFLFKFLILKSYWKNEDIFILPKNVKIYIEIPNGFINFESKFQILTLIPEECRVMISSENLSTLIFEKKFGIDVQVVCNYLKLRKEKKIDEVDLIFEDITPDELWHVEKKEKKGKKETKIEVSKIFKNAEKLAPEVCHKLIFDIFKEKVDEIPSYYQIISFINILADQLKKFNKSYYLNAEELSSKPYKILRSHIVEGFIDSTIYFTKAAYSKLINEQIQTHKIIRDYNEQEDIEEGIKNLDKYKENNVSYDKINSPLIFFHEGKDIRFKIITNSPKTEEEKKINRLFVNLINKQEIKKEDRIKQLPDYKSFKSQEQFYKVFQEILNIDNPINELKKNEVKEIEDNEGKKVPLKSIKEIAKDYVFTADNFLKMVLILIRIRSNIPVIMMGETGCGKTSLIRKLAELKNNGDSSKMIIKNIHAGTNDKDIIKFIEKEVKPIADKIDQLNLKEEEKEKEKEKESKKKSVFPYEPEKLWVFLDEINTCKSMGLISELMCKRSYQGKEINKCITFIAACNPYRYIEVKDEDEIALNINLAVKEKGKINDKGKEKLEKQDKKSKLVYTVNPLPHSLLNYVFDFGSLNEDDEHRYIENMIEKPFDEIFNLSDNLNLKEKKEDKKEKQKNEIKEKKQENEIKQEMNEIKEEKQINEIKEEKQINEIKEENQIIKIKEEKQENEKTIDSKDIELKNIKDLAVCLVSKAQIFIRKNIDASSVSLREIRKFIIFYKFFFGYLEFKKEKYLNLNLKDTKFNYENLSKFELQIYSINLSVFMCYYLRLSNKNLREQLRAELNEILQKFSNDKYKFPDFLELPILEEKFIANNIDIPKGIAKNKALLENLFSLFVCINNKIPLFIVGKPGCSKSLSVEYILKSMKGEFTKNIFFKKYPNLMCTKYQGSLCSESEEILNVFNKAKKALKKIKDEDLKRNISLIYFDEMGLAEHSKFNPLKTIHSELELDDSKDEEKKKIAFVGISNWSLDASKMNRGIHISIPDLDREDNIETALTIAESYKENLTNSDILINFFKNLGNTYFEYKKELKANINIDWKKEFHGHRDFYFFVKICAKIILLNLTHKKANIEKDYWLAGFESIERNFSGLEFDDGTSVEKVKAIYEKAMPENISNSINKTNKPDVVKLIQDNLNDLNSRYLLVIAKPSISCHLVKKILKNYNYFIFMGSKFKNDFKCEDYHYKVINKIQVCMEKGGIIVLKDFDYIYPSLYDLLNQNFTVETKRNFARISFKTSNSYNFVNDNFKCIIIVDNDQVPNQETPFLNRFEKHIIIFEILLSDVLIKEANYIYNTLKELFEQIKKFNIIQYDLDKIIVNCNLEEIEGLIYEAKEKGIEQEKMKKEVFSKFALTLPQDVMLLLNKTNFEYKDLLIENYNKGEHRSLSKFLSLMNSTKSVIYTFSTDLDIIRNLKNIKNEHFNFIIGEENIKKIKIRGIKSESQFEKEVDNFLKNERYKVCLVQFTSHEENFMDFIKFTIENKEKEEGNKEKIFIFIVHMNRIFPNKQNIDNNNNIFKEKKEYKNLNEDFSFLSGYYQIFIDNLNGDEKISLSKIVEIKNEDSIDFYLDLDDEIKKNIFKAITYMKYDISSFINNLNRDNYVEYLQSFLKDDENKNIRKLINSCIKRKLNQDNILGILYEEKKEDNDNKKSELIISEYDLGLMDLIKKYLFNSYISTFNYFLFLAENDNFFSSLLTLKNKFPDFFNYFNSIDEDRIIKIEKNEIKLLEKSKGDMKYKLLSYIIIEYLKDFSFERNDMKFIEKQQKANNINILLGLTLPGFKKNIEDIISKINENITNNFYINEAKMINNPKEIQDIYYNELERFNNLAKNEILRCNKISKIHNEFKDENIIIDDFYDLFINDYYTLLISDNLGNDIELEETKLFFNDLGNDKLLEEKIFKYSKIINYIEGYKPQMIILLKVYSKSKKLGLKPNSFEIKRILVRRNESHEISSYIKNFMRMLFGEKLINIINKDNISKIKEFFEEIYLHLSKIIASINSKDKPEEIYSLKEIAEILYELEKNGILEQNILKKIFQYFLNKTKILYEEILENDILEDLVELYNSLEKTIGKTENFPKLMYFLLINEFKQSHNEILKKWIMDIIISNIDILKKSHLEVILNNYFKKNDFTSYLNKLSEQNRIFDSLNNDNKILEQILLNYFENNIYSYFKNNTQINETSKNRGEQLLSKEKRFFIEFNNAVKIFSGEHPDKDIFKYNYRLKKIYSIAYIKIYLKFFVEFITKENLEINISHIDDTIAYIKNEKYKNIIRLYIYKLFLYFLRDEKQFLSYEYRNKYITFFEDFKLQPKYAINYYNFLPLSSFKDKYYKALQLFDEYKKENYNNDDEIRKFKKEIEEFPFEIIINIIINRFISKFGLNQGYNKDEYNDILKFVNEIITETTMHKKISRLLIMYNDKNSYKTKLKEKLGEDGFLVSLYGLRYVIYSLKNEKINKNYYSELLHIKKYKLPKDINLIAGTETEDNPKNLALRILTKDYEEGAERCYNSLEKKFKKIFIIRFLILNFIISSYLFFAGCLNKLNPEKCKILPKDDNNYYQLMKKNLLDISDYLKSEYIYNTEIFLHLIFEKLSNLIISSKSFDKKEQTKEFEIKVDEIIIDILNNYNDKKAEYIKENYNLLQDKDEFKNYLIVKELVPIEDLEEDMKMFLFTEYHDEFIGENKNYFENYILKKGLRECSMKYPLLFQVLFYKDEVKKLKYLSDINNLSNYLIKKFSYRISRKEANHKSINNNDFKIDNNLLTKFISSWNKLYELNKFQYNNLSENNPLIDFLIESKEKSNFNQINKIYRDLIKHQNNFLTPIIKNNKTKKGILHFYYDTLRKEINIQDSKDNEIDLSNIDLNDIILRNSKRNIFTSDNKIDFYNYNNFAYDLESIERELGEKILPGKCLFKNEEMRTITFLGEGAPDILTKFVLRYNQIEVKDKGILFNFVKKNYLKGKSMKDFYESFQVLFFYLTEDKNELNLEINLNYLLKLIPDLNLSDDFKQFLEEQGRDFKLNEIFEVYLYLEHLYFELLLSKENIEKTNFNKSINDNDKDEFEKIEFKFKDDFIMALRRYITRNLIGNKYLYIDLKENLINQLLKSDLWGINQMKNFEEVKTMINNDLKFIDIKIEQALTLYEYIGQKDTENVLELIKEIKAEKEKEFQQNDDGDNISVGEGEVANLDE